MAETHPTPTSARALARNTLWNFAGQAAPWLVAIVSIPALVGALGPDRFGVLSLAWMVVGYFGLFDFGLGRALTQVVAARLGSERHEEIPALVWTSLGIMLGLSLLGAGCGLALSPWLVERVLNVPAALRGETLHAFALLALSLPIVVTTPALRGILEAHQRFGLTSLLRLAMGLATFLTPLAVLPFSHNLVVVVAALVAGRAVAWAIHLGLCLRVMPALRRRGAIRRAEVRPLLRLGGWMTVSNILSPLMETLDRLLIGGLVSVAAVTYYATPADAVTKLLIVPAALSGVVFPAFAAGLGRDRAAAGQLYERTTAAVFAIVFPLVLAVVVLAREGLHLWLGARFAEESTHVLQVLAVGVLANSVAQVSFALVQGAGRADLTAKLHLIEFPLYLVATVALVRWSGAGGAAVAWTLRMVADLLLLRAAGRRILPAPAGSRGRTAVVAAALLTLGLAVLPTGAPAKALFLLVALGAAAALLWRTLAPVGWRPRRRPAAGQLAPVAVPVPAAPPDRWLPRPRRGGAR